MDDRRKHRRFAVNLPCQIRRDKAQDAAIAAAVIDVSTGGVRVVTEAEWPTGSPVVLEWDRAPFLSGAAGVCAGKTIHVRRSPAQPGAYCIGVEFADADSDLVKQLVRWAQMQSLVQSRSRLRSGARDKGKEKKSWY